MLLATRSALAADRGLLEAGEPEVIELLLAELESTAAGSDATAIEAAVLAVAESTEAFAAARMNQGIRQALSGRTLDEI
jgi:molecular chaperone HscA